MGISGSRVLIAGGGGSIGRHLAVRLHAQGCEDIRCVDHKPTSGRYQAHDEAENRVLDLRLRDGCKEARTDRDVVFNFACDMAAWASSNSTRPRAWSRC